MGAVGVLAREELARLELVRVGRGSSGSVESGYELNVAVCVCVCVCVCEFVCLCVCVCARACMRV